MTTQAERNERLVALRDAVVEYADAEKKRLEKQVERNQQILDGRVGSESLAKSSVEASKALAVNEIASFLTGGS